MPVSEPGFLAAIAPASTFPRPRKLWLKRLWPPASQLAVVLMNGSAWPSIGSTIMPMPFSNRGTQARKAGLQSPRRSAAGTTLRAGCRLPSIRASPSCRTLRTIQWPVRTYRYFKGKPLYPFGYGLSYTTFKYSDLNIPQQPVDAGNSVDAGVTVTNTGSRAGDEVVQLYLSFPDVKGAPAIALRGFQRIHLDIGESRTVHFELKGSDCRHGDRRRKSDCRSRGIHNQCRRRPA